MRSPGALCLLPCLAITLFLAGCSWQIPFLIANQSTTPRKITVRLEIPASGIPLFRMHLMQRLPLTDGNADFSRGESLNLAETWEQVVVIEPNHALELGRLSNEDYQSSDQHFINGRVFNLAEIRSENTRITRQNFDQYFVRDRGCIVWNIR